MPDKLLQGHGDLLVVSSGSASSQNHSGRSSPDQAGGWTPVARPEKCEIMSVPSSIQSLRTCQKPSADSSCTPSAESALSRQLQRQKKGHSAHAPAADSTQ